MIKIRVIVNGLIIDEDFYSVSAIKELEEVGIICKRVQ